MAFLARHGAGHRLLPSELNFRANIFGFKLLGVERIISASAVGSLKEEYPPLDIVVPDQFFDRTKGRISTFFGGGLAAHVSFAHPICPELAQGRRRRGAGGWRKRASRRDLRLHGGPAVLDAGRVEALSILGHGRDRDDEPAGSQARARSRDLLRHAGARHRLRLLASRSRLGDRRDDRADADAEREDGPARHRRGHREAPRRALVRVRFGAEVRAHHATRSRSGAGRSKTWRRSSANTFHEPYSCCRLRRVRFHQDPVRRSIRVVGGAATYFAIAASFFTEVRIVAVVGEDFGANVEKVFGGRRIDLAGLENVPGETFRWKGEYGFDLNSRETIYTHLNVFEKFTPKIPASHRSSPFVFLGNIHPTLQMDVLESGAEAEARRRRHDELLD